MEIDDISDILPGCPASLPSVKKSGLCCHVLADESVACQEGLASHCYVLNATKTKKHTLQNKLISTLIILGTSIWGATFFLLLWAEKWKAIYDIPEEFYNLKYPYNSI